MSVLILFLEVHAQDKNAIISLDQGACWVQMQGPQKVKLASFIDATTAMITAQTIDAWEEVISNLYEKEFQKEAVFSDLKISFFCGSYGAYVLFSSVQNNICLWQKWNQEGLVIEELTPLLEESSNGSCLNYKYLSVLASVKPTDEQTFIQSLQNAELQEYVDSWSKVAKETYSLTLHPSWKGLEKKVINELYEFSYFRKLELNSYQHPSGEFFPLN